MRQAVPLTLLILSMIAASQPGFRLTVYEDGVVAVEEVVMVEPSSAELKVQLLSPNPENLLVNGPGGEPLDYRLENGFLVVDVYGIGWVKVYYEVVELTSKEAAVWRLAVTLPDEAEIVFPEGSIIIYVNAPPTEIGAESGAPKLLLQPGEWEIEYVLELTPHAQSTGFPVWWAVAMAVAVAAASALLFLRLRSRAMDLRELTEDERKVLELVRELGRVSEAEIRQRLRLPKTTAWRVVRRLERRGLVRVRKIGGRNEVEPA